LLPVRFAHEDAVAGEHVAALDERRRPRRDGSSSSCHRLAEHRTPVLRPAWAVLPRRFRSSALTRLRRVGLPPRNRARSTWQKGTSIVMLSSHMTDHGEQSYPQFFFTASDGPCARGVPFNSR
jgi:hypothetical protein